MRTAEISNVMYVHVDMTHEKSEEALAYLRAKHEGMNNFLLSVNMKKDGQEAIVKIVGMTPADVLKKSWSGAVMQMFPKARRDHVRARVKALDWADPIDVDKLANSTKDR